VSNFDVSLTNRDAESLTTDIFSKVSSWSGGKYTDFSDSDPGTILLKTFIKLHDMGNNYIDMAARECFPTRAVQRKNVRAALSSVGYIMRGYTSSEVLVTGSLVYGLDVDVAIEKYHKLECAIPYVVKSRVVIPTGATSFTFTAIQGVPVDYTFSLTDVDSKGRIYLQNKILCSNDVGMTINDVTWYKVDNVFILDDLGKYFHVDFDDNDEMYIQLIPGYTNYLSGSGATIKVKALESLGSEGTIAAGGYEGIIYGFLDSVIVHSVDIKDTFSFSHPASNVLGDEPEGIDEALIQSIKNLRIMDSIVSLPDWGWYCEGFAGIKKARAVDIDVEGAGITEPYVVKVYVAGDGGTAVSNGKITEITDSINNGHKCLRGVSFQILNGVVHLATGTITVHLSNGNSDRSLIESNIRAAWSTFFDSEDREFEENFNVNKLFTYLSKSHESISYIESANILSDQLAYNEIAYGGSLTLLFVVD
jgi:hypothetical protein